MKTPLYNVISANHAVAKIAFKTNEVFPIYPITPASEMSELVEQWSTQNKQNLLDSIPTSFEMQSEAGVAGAMHGALQTGSLSSTFTSSQGLLLMLPNMYKIAGELTPNVIHVATRSLATHALSVYGDHSDIMAVRQSGYAFLGSASVQEAHDFALISQAATLKSRIPFVHFFDGFRTSHEINTIEEISNKIIKDMISVDLIDAHRNRALNPNNPVLRGSSQASDVFFQSREATNSFYNACPNIVQNEMNMFSKLTGRQYNLFDYVGDPQAEFIIISMASSTETIEATINHLNAKGAKLGLIKVRLFRPFSTKHLIEALPSTVKSIAVLDRTKEPGSTGEPLYLDIVQSVSEAFQNNSLKTFPKIIGGRYGLSSKAFTPTMVNAIFKNLRLKQPKNSFTVGIDDDVTHLSLDCSEIIEIESSNYQAIFYQEKCKIATNSFARMLESLGKQNSDFVQGYTECDYKKSNSRNVAHLRIGLNPIRLPNLIENADFIACQNVKFINNDNAIDRIKTGGSILVNTTKTSKTFWQTLSANIQYQIIEKDINLLIVNSSDLKESSSLKNSNLSELHICFLALKNEVISTELISEIIEYIYKVDTTIGYKEESISFEYDASFNETILGKLLENKGNSLPVSLMPVDGTYPTNTSQFNPVQNGNKLPEWYSDLCTQCGACTMACPQASLRVKVYNNTFLETAPEKFKSSKSNETDWEVDLLNYSIQNNPEQCNSCNNCVDACPAKALTMVSKEVITEQEIANWNHFETIPEFNREKIDTTKVSQQQLQEPLFKYSIGVEGCGEAPYLKLVSQLFGERLLVANATGASSIFGGALPTTPWSKNKQGQGPAWSNSLFEDNAEFGLGFRLSLDQQEQQAKVLLKKLLPYLDFDLVDDILKATQYTEQDINEQRLKVEVLKNSLRSLDSQEAMLLLKISDSLVKKSVWIIGGDGWAYDIGYGGLDHVMASGKDVNILVIDNEVYDNTGGQSSKSTPFGAKAKFAFGGKQKQKKDLGALAMQYENIYVASIAIGANQEQTLKAINEAESFNGPSIIIAYAHSESHGIDMKHPSQYHKAAVKSGQWLLYRNDPRRAFKGLNTLQLDSQKPTLKIQEYLMLEDRFKNIFNRNESDLKSLIKRQQQFIDKRFNHYLSMATEMVIPRSKLLQNRKMINALKTKIK